MSILAVGTSFRSYDDLYEALRNYEQGNNVKLWKRSSLSIEGAAKGGMKRSIKPELKYAKIIFSCVHANGYKSRSTGQRNTKTIRQQCPFLLKIHTSTDGSTLYVSKVIDNHIHEKIQDLPKKRIRRNPESKSAVKELQVIANLEKQNCKQVESTTGSLTLIERVGEKCSESLLSAFNVLQNNENSTVVVLQDGDNNLLGVFYQDLEMKKTFSAYPEVLFLDSFYKNCDQSTLLYILMIENGNGEIEIIGFFMLICQEAWTLTAVASVFKSHNPKWRSIQCICSDKHFLEINAFAEEFPFASHMISYFHTMRTFNAEVCTEKLGISIGQCNVCLTFIQRLVSAKNERDYIETLKILEEIAPQIVMKYFYANWHDTRSQWVTGLHQKLGPRSVNQTNICLETLNQKVSEVVTKHLEIESILQGLMELIAKLRTENESNTSNLIKSSESEMQYLKVLTPYAFSLVTKQLVLKNNVIISEEVNGFSLVQSSEGKLQVSKNMCDCVFFKNMRLPCRHILKVREIKGLDLFSEDLIATRWTKQLFLNRTTNKNNNISSNNNVIVHTVHAERQISQLEKQQRALTVCEKLASLVTEVPTRQCSQRLSMLETLAQIWQLNKDA